ncbi:TlpA family protein disulfide reductase [Sinosporangium siamense]|uniref:Membrane protein n=1 Tax=Sinosporangium siamense TaxID=1367973 RepID=A0A919RLC9_9ACTN|nr:TlpA disulfide reductase family protein [Sinosporangium siamense]GII94529.1 membrane protein [Sinosporangium siamense]
MTARPYLVAGAVALGACGLAAVLAQGLLRDGAATPVVPARATAPNVSGTTLGGERFALAGLRGHVVLVTVWASWCGTCRQELPMLADLARRLRPRGLRVVGLNIRDSPRVAEAFLREIGISDAFPHLTDPDGRLALELGVFGVPETYVLDRDGTVARRGVGPVDAEWLDRHLLPRLAR